MKKVASLSLIVLLLTISVNASALKWNTPSPQPTQTPAPKIGLDFFAVIAASYLSWAEIIGISNLETEPSYYNVKDYTLLFIDDLSIKYNPKSFETESVDLFYMSEATDNQPVSLRSGRALCLFAAIEIGKPAFDSSNEVDSMLDYTWAIYEQFSDCIADNYDAIKDGQSVAFYTGNSGLTYSVLLDETVGIIIHIE